MSPETVNQHLERLSALYRWAVDRGHVTTNPFERVKVKVGARVKAAKKKKVPYTHAEVEKVLSVLDPGVDERHWLILIALYTGCRINEAAQLYADDISTAGGIPFILSERAGRTSA